MSDDNDGLLAGLGIVGVGLLGLVAWLVTSDDSSSRTTSVDTSGGGTTVTQSAPEPDSLTGVTGTINYDVGGSTGPGSDLGTGGSASPDEFDSAEEATLAELYDTDTGD